ncbi:MAG: ABC transporter substrate-binding protein [SAR324 cluster bacterium]|nr:ABC transporter substrate-binding protein [SAR324 cluster bacterium]
MLIRHHARPSLTLAIMLVYCTVALGAELTVGVQGSLRSLDPHYYNLAANNALNRHIYDALVVQDAQGRLYPGLAVHWKSESGNAWQFVLRRGVRFHDGSPLTADDVIYSLARARSVPNSPASFARHTRHIISMEKVDEITVRLRTAGPRPALPRDLSHVRIMSLKASEGKHSAQIDAGDGAVGTGPYRLAAWKPGTPLVLDRNEQYWATAPPWTRVTFLFIPDGARRVQALLAGEVDAIEAVPPDAIERLAKKSGISIIRRQSSRLIFLHLDSGRKKSPFVTGTRGINPLQKLQVRKGISLAINRSAIASDVMEGLAVPSGQLLPKGHFGHIPALKPDRFNRRGAKRLLARGGFPRGFGLTLHGPNNQFPFDAQLLEAIAGALKRIGIRAETETKSRRIFFTIAARREFSAYLSRWNDGAAGAAAMLRSLLASYDPERRMGMRNHGRFSDPALDTALERALTAMDNERRAYLLQEATRIGIAAYGIIPLFFEVDTWAMRKGFTLRPGGFGAILATDFRPSDGD